MTDAALIIANPPPDGLAQNGQKMAETSQKSGIMPSDAAPLSDVDRRRIFIDILCDTGNVVAAAAKVELSRDTLHRWRKTMPDFRADWETAIELAAEALESEAFRRALQGSDTVETTTVVQPSAGGKTSGEPGESTRTIRRSSDALLLALLKAHRPDKYGAPSGRQQETRNVQVVISDNV